MADLNGTPHFALSLAGALREGLLRLGFPADVEFEPVPGTPRYRFYVESARFAGLPHSESQAMVWQIAERALNPDDQLHVSMILTLAPSREASA